MACKKGETYLHLHFFVDKGDKRWLQMMVLRAKQASFQARQ
jgi:hypothetical protein